MLSQAETERLKARLDLCRCQIKRAKSELIFWNQELFYVVDSLKQDKQFNFDQYFQEQENL